jgi:hypothetical protein
MTVSNPYGEPTLLASVLRTEHDRLDGLLDEATVRTPTPGVRRDLSRQLAEAALAHTFAESRVLHHAARDVLGNDVMARLAQDADIVRSVFTRTLDGDEIPEAWIAELRQTLDAHRMLIDDDVLPAMAARVPDRMATLGYEFGRELEAGSRPSGASGRAVS